MSQFGVGLYTLPEAARLIRTEAREIRRWLFGYEVSRSDGKGGRHYATYQPLWKPAYADDKTMSARVIGFRDLLELRIVREFVTSGVPLLVVRRCLETAKELFHVDYPFTAKRFLTDGQTIFVEALSSDKEQALLDLRKKQYAFKAIIKPSLYAGIEYDGALARRWFPQRGNKVVVVDPRFQFGKPVVGRTAVPTTALYGSYKAEGGDRSAMALVARMFEIEAKEVEAAVRFEETLLAA